MFCLKADGSNIVTGNEGYLWSFKLRITEGYDDDFKDVKL